MKTRSAHAGPRRGSTEPTIPAPSHAERSRTLLHLSSSGTLATESRKHPGYPFASVMPYALDEEGNPIVLISALAMHTQNLRADAKCSLLVTQGAGDDLGAGRVTLLAEAEQLPAAGPSEEDAEGEASEGAAVAARDLYLEAHPRARHWVDYADFSFFRLTVREIYFVGGFGVMGWVEATDFQGARPDPLAESAAGILEHMNSDHGEALLLLSRHLAGVEADEASMTAIDRLGFHLRLRADGHYQSHRIPFPEEISSTNSCRQALVAMTRDAREVLGANAPAKDSSAENSSKE